MSKFLINTYDNEKAVADAIRAKKGTSDTIKVSEFATEIENLPSGGDHTIEDAFITKTLTSYTNDRVTTVGYYTFANQSSLVTADIPNTTSLGNYAFSYCSKLEGVNTPKITSIGMYGFQYCTSLKEANFPLAKDVAVYAFQSCTSLTTVNLPIMTVVNGYVFNKCSALTSVNIPKASSIGNFGFANCTSLTTLDLPTTRGIGNSTFQNCSSLVTLILRYTSGVCTYSTTSSANDPSNSDLKIYVPSALLSKYQSATNWARLSSHFVALESYTDDGTVTGNFIG